MGWRRTFRYDPATPLIQSGDNAIEYFARRDLLQEAVGPIAAIWDLKAPRKILKNQQPDGYWKYPGKGEDYRLLATLQNLQCLIYQYEFDRAHPLIDKACEYFFSYQTDEGDFRGMIGNQYAPYYTGLIMALLINAGYEQDARLEKGFNWLLSMRQNDGGWVIGSPGLTGIQDLKWKDMVYLTSSKDAPTFRSFDKSQPFSHSGTGMVIRALAAHSQYKKSPEALRAAQLIKSQFFKEDNSNSYKHADHWIRFEFPFWWNNLLAALDSISRIGIPASDPDVRSALNWLIENQEESGLWRVSYSKIHKASVNKKTAEQKLWIALSIGRIFKRFYE